MLHLSMGPRGFSFGRLYVSCREFRTQTSKYLNTVGGTNQNDEGNPSELDLKLKKRIFNTVLWATDPEVPYMRRKAIAEKNFYAKSKQIKDHGVSISQPICLNLLNDDSNSETRADVVPTEITDTGDEHPNYPFAANTNKDTTVKSRKSRNESLLRGKMLEVLEEKKDMMSKWMSDYDLYDEKITSPQDSSSSPNFGTSDPQVPVSKIPCGGCGAYLHCQDHSIPGYLPKEIFVSRTKKELRSLTCQRCHFLREFNVALDVHVSPEEYPNIISCIKDRRAIAVLMIDLLDFPCSIWPGIMDIIGSQRPVVVVGNKVDLIPGDQVRYLKHLEETLTICIQKMGISKANIKHVALISAQTGFGVEDLITRLHDLWEYKSDVFLLGCTNVGKSTLFNQLLNSDFCKTQAADLVQRATTSVWPGTTLNLLKFPILRPEGWRLAERRKRLLSQAWLSQQGKLLKKQQLQRRRMYHIPSLVQYVGRTFINASEIGKEDLYLIQKANTVKSGIDEKDPEYRQGRWCYDTPGVMHPDQILNILTTEELTKVIPKSPIIPRFFNLKPGRSLFLAGLGRIDLVTSFRDKSVRVAVFSSEHLPVSIVNTEDAEQVYKKLLGTELMAVPCGNSLRLADWPGLTAKDELIALKGLGWQKCCADIVLSSAGWVAISGGEHMDMSFRVWTPCARGIHIREPALLPFAINFRGERIDHTPTFYAGHADGKLAPPTRSSPI